MRKEDGIGNICVGEQKDNYLIEFLKAGSNESKIFIQHRKFCMLDEMLDAFEMSEIYKKIQKEEKNRVG